MENEVMKFRDSLTKPILTGEKNITWRLFDDKDLKKGDVVDFVNWNTGEIFCKAELTDVWEKAMNELDDSDFDGHEKFSSDEEMYQTYRTYYGDSVGPRTIVKIIRFRLL